MKTKVRFLVGVGVLILAYMLIWRKVNIRTGSTKKGLMITNNRVYLKDYNNGIFNEMDNSKDVSKHTKGSMALNEQNINEMVQDLASHETRIKEETNDITLNEVKNKEGTRDIAPKEEQNISDLLKYIALKEERNTDITDAIAPKEEKNKEVINDILSNEVKNKEITNGIAPIDEHNKEVINDAVSKEAKNIEGTNDVAPNEIIDKEVINDVAPKEERNKEVINDIAPIEEHNIEVKNDVVPEEEKNKEATKDIASIEEHNNVVINDVASIEAKNIEETNENAAEQQNIDNDNDESQPFNEQKKEVVPLVLPETVDLGIQGFRVQTEKVNTIEAGFITSPTHLCSNESMYMTLLILVPSSPDRMAARKAIRETYGSYTKNPLRLNNFIAHVRLAFLVGNDQTPVSDYNIRQEYETYGDIIYTDDVEEYNGLTKKMLTGLKWIANNCKQLDYLLKIDDDVFVNIRLLAKTLHERPYDSRGCVYGQVIVNSPVYRKGQWAVAKDEFPGPRYPTYASGGSYVISGNILTKIYLISQYVRIFKFEDVFITGLVGGAVGTKYRNMPNFNRAYEVEYSACDFVRNRRITMHGLEVRKFYLFWATLKNFGKVCHK